MTGNKFIEALWDLQVELERYRGNDNVEDDRDAGREDGREDANWIIAERLKELLEQYGYKK